MFYCVTFFCWQDTLYMLQYEEYHNLNTHHPHLHIHTNSYSTISSDTIFYGIWYECIRSTLYCDSSTTFYTINGMKKITHKNGWKLFSCTSMSMITQTVRCQCKHQSKINCFRPVNAMKVYYSYSTLSSIKPLAPERYGSDFKNSYWIHYTG